MVRRLAILLVLTALAVFGGRAALVLGASTVPAAERPSALPELSGQERRVAIILGAGLRPDGTPSRVLADRITAGVELLRDGTVDLVLMSGDNSVEGYSEPSAMRSAALQQGARPEQIAVDYGGRRTWDSCARARRVFGVDHAIVVTNDFHRARSVVLCRSAGITVDAAVGTPTERYRARPTWVARETVASWRGAFDAWIKQPTVAVGGTPIDPFDRCAVWASLSDRDQRAAPSLGSSC